MCFIIFSSVFVVFVQILSNLMKAFTKSGYDGHGCKYKMYYLIWSDEFRKTYLRISFGWKNL